MRGKFNTTQNSGSFRFTYQANPKNKFFVSHEPQGRTWIDATAATSPESFTDYQFTLQRMSSAGWTGTLSNKLLASVKWGDHGEAFGDSIPPDAPYNTLITVHETGGQFIQPQNYRGRGHGGNQAVAPGYHTEPHDQQLNASLSYVTGSHNLKFGFQDQWGTIDLFSETVPANVDYYFVNGVPNQVRQWALPIHTTDKLSAEMGLYAQDAWTIKRATINVGLRFDYFKNSFPEQHARSGSVRAESGHHLRADQLLQHEGPDAARRHCLRPLRQRQDRAEGALGQVRAWASRPAPATRWATCPRTPRGRGPTTATFSWTAI